MCKGRRSLSQHSRDALSASGFGFMNFLAQWERVQEFNIFDLCKDPTVLLSTGQRTFQRVCLPTFAGRVLSFRARTHFLQLLLQVCHYFPDQLSSAVIVLTQTFPNVRNIGQLFSDASRIFQPTDFTAYIRTSSWFNDLICLNSFSRAALFHSAARHGSIHCPLCDHVAGADARRSFHRATGFCESHNSAAACFIIHVQFIRQDQNRFLLKTSDSVATKRCICLF